jgi:hypothetical protein
MSLQVIEIDCVFASSNKLGYDEDKDLSEEDKKSQGIPSRKKLDSSNDSRRYSSGKIILLHI